MAKQNNIQFETILIVLIIALFVYFIYQMVKEHADGGEKYHNNISNATLKANSRVYKHGDKIKKTEGELFSKHTPLECSALCKNYDECVKSNTPNNIFRAIAKD